MASTTTPANANACNQSGSAMPTDTEIQFEGDTWRVIGMGAKRDGRTYCHLASTTRFREQRNGRVAIQMADWLDDELLSEEALPRARQTQL